MHHNLHQAQSHDILRSWQSQRYDVNHHKDFVLPMFIGNDDDSIETIESMPEVYRYGCNRAIEYLEPLVYKHGLRSVLLFPVVTKSEKDKMDAARDSDNNSSDSDDGPAESSDDSSSVRSSSRSRRRYSSSSSSSILDDEVRPERLVDVTKSVNNKSSSGANNSQNPFLSQNDEEDHLLAGEHIIGDDGSPVVLATASTVNATTTTATTSIVAAAAEASKRDNNMVIDTRKVSRTQDVRLIKGMALKDRHNPVLRLIPRLRSKFPRLLIICDVCLCAFTSTGHCCLFEDHNRAKSTTISNNKPSSTINILNQFPISNKTTCQYLAMLSVEYALRGCNVVAPSDMMDGRILTIREKLNEAGLYHVSILSYSAKFASAFYGPFRQATNNAPEFGDRGAYQLPPGSRALALKAVQRDISQGADFVMVKPAGPYLDIVRDIREQHPETPVAVYQVSGEYSLLKIGAQAGVVDLGRAVREVLTAYRRSGANIIITYFTPELLKGQFNIDED